MNRTLAPTVAAVMTLCVLASSRTPAMAVNGVLRAWPEEGHSGGVIYLSGSGLPPRRQLTVLMACPNWFAPHVWEYNNAILQPGPMTDSNGEFVAHRLQPYHLNRISSSPCRIYTSDQEHTFGPDIAAFYTIRARDDALPRSDLQIKVTASALLKKIHAGSFETITITGWAGARTVLKVSLPGGKSTRRVYVLDPKGERQARIKIPSIRGGPVRATVSVHCQLGAYLGDASPTHFLVAG